MKSTASEPGLIDVVDLLLKRRKYLPALILKIIENTKLWTDIKIHSGKKATAALVTSQIGDRYRCVGK